MEKKDQLVKKKFIFQAIINSIEKENQDSKIKTKIVEGYQEPSKIMIKEDQQKGYTPDVVSETKNKTDLTMTGVFLALIGLVSVILYGLVGRSQWAVGAYFGGVACVVIGFILTTIGLVARILRRPPHKPE